MSDRVYTVLVVPERSSTVRRYKIPRRIALRTVFGLCALMSVAGFMIVHYFYVVDQAADNPRLKQENVELRNHVRRMQDEVARIDNKLQRIEQLSSQIFAITQLSDPERNLAIGPLASDKPSGLPRVLYAQGERIDDEDEAPDSKLALRLIDSKLDNLEVETLRVERQVRELHDYFEDDEMRLGSTPSIRPVHSKLLTSTFGMRSNPYTDRRSMHKGLDFAADHGSDVLAPADGMVVFVGLRGDYGNSIVIDHGYGLQTHYAHLSRFRVEVGQRVGRGQVIGAVGQTGRTTGVHLHYEVRLHGIPQDPERYIFD